METFVIDLIITEEDNDDGALQGSDGLKELHE